MRHEDSSPDLDKERGSRYWSAAELLSSTWFVVETCIEVSGVNEIRRWVTTSISDAANLQDSQRPFIWSQIFVCLRAPHSVRSATVFEVVKEAYQLGPIGSYLYRLDNGISFSTDEAPAQDIQSNPVKLQLVYSQRR